MLARGQLTQRCTDLQTGLVTLIASDAPSELHIDEHQLINTFGPEYQHAARSVPVRMHRVLWPPWPSSTALQ
jgi:hypothetical protein